MKISKTAKRKWFEDNILDFELYFHFDNAVIKIVDYCCFEGLYEEDLRHIPRNPKVRSFMRDIINMSADKIFFKCHKYYKKTMDFELRYTKYQQC